MIFFANNVYAIPPSPNHPCHKEGNCPKDPDQVSTGPSIIKSNKFGITSPILPSDMTTGTKKIVIIPVVFSDIKNSTTIAKLNSTVQNISVYYKENSYNKLNFTVVLIPKWYSLNRTMVSYGADNTSCAVYRDFGRWVRSGCNYAWMGSREFVIDSLTISDSEINFSNYDHVIIVHAGNDEASSDEGNDLWSVRWPGLNFSTNDSAIVNGSTILAETSPLGTFLHELAHDLGAPDLYNTANSLSVVGYWDLMDIGSWAGNPQGSNPSHLSSWNKILFKWISPIYVSPSTSYNLTILPLESIATGIKTVKVPMITNSSQEYFLVENRQKTVGTYDASLPESGIVVWHIDDTQGSISQNNINNGVIKRVIPENQNPGTSSLDDAAYNQGNQNFAPSTNPNSNMNNGFSSNISIGNWLKNDISFFVFFNNWYITTTTTSTTTSTSTTSTTISTTTSTSTTTTIPANVITSCPYTINNPGKYSLGQNLSSTGTCLIINANNVQLDCQYNKIVGDGVGTDYGIYVNGSNSYIANCSINGFYDGMFIYQSNNSYIKNNSVSNNTYAGIVVGWNSNNTYLIGNILNSNYWAGMYCFGSVHNTSLIGNIANSNSIYGIYLSDSSNDIVKGNILNSNGYYGIGLSGSASNMIINNTLNSNMQYGIRMLGADNNTIRDNVIQYNQVGIFYETSTISNNLIFNNFFRNSINAKDNGVNFWNATKTLGTNIVGRRYLGGNFWNDYTGQDIDGDGIGDTKTPYNSSGNIAYGGDYLPLVYSDTTPPVITILSPQNDSYYKQSVPLNFTVNENTSWIGYSLDNQPNVTINGNTSLTLTDGSHNVIVDANDSSGNMGASNKTYFFYCKGDITKDKIIDIFDLVNVALAFGSQPGNPNWNVNADLNNDNVIDIFDIVVIATDYGKTC